MEIGIYNVIGSAYFKAGYVINGTETEVVSVDIFGTLDGINLTDWPNGVWRFVRVEGYESGGKFNVSIYMTLDISSPDPANPPEDQLILIGSASIDIPTELSGGGVCGLVVGSEIPSGSNATTGKPYYDYTQIYY